MAWTLQQSSVDDMVESWRWLHRNRLADLQTANDTVNTLWQRGAYLEAQHAWVDWLADPETGYPDTQRLDDPRFERQTGNTPFGWDLAPRPGIEYARHDGLEVRFLGQTNVADAGVRQHAVVSPGRYRLVADVSADHISTDEGLFFQVTDVEQPDRLQVRTAPILGTLARTTVTLDVTVPVGTRVVRVELARHPSLRFDSALSGVLTIHRLSLN
jgi:hypothetical protein